MDTIFALGLLVAVAAAIRGVWSPCGLSMLSSITPMTEQGRGNRFGVTAAWFVAGSVLGGLTLGAVAAGAASAVAFVDPSDATRYAIAALAATITAGIDLGAFGVELPIFKRQVDDAWLRRYRSWVYGAGFGWQIGVGVATYIMTAGVFLTIALAVLTASPVAAVAIGATFGLVRGSTVYLTRRAHSAAALGRVHEMLDRLAPASKAFAAGTQVLAAVVCASLAGGPAAGGLVAVVALGYVVVSGRTAGSEAATA